MPSLRVLITNIRLTSRSGTEMYVRDLALELLGRDHRPIVYSQQLGSLAEELRQASVPVVDCLANITEPPDIVHGHHSLETMAAMLHFPRQPGVFVCHDFAAWHDTPPRSPRLLRYVAVDDACRERLTIQHGIPAEIVRVIHNAVDLRRFRQRGPLPQRPRRALLISNYVDATQLPAVQAACDQAGVGLDVVGQRLNGECDQPEALLQNYDLVFAKGRCAWEALATGTAVVVLDAMGMGPLVTLAELEQLRRWNFGRRLLREPLTVENIAGEIARYDAHDAMRVSDRIRAFASTDLLVEHLLYLYLEVIEEHRVNPLTDLELELKAASSFIQFWSRKKQDLLLPAPAPQSESADEEPHPWWRVAARRARRVIAATRRRAA